MTQKPGFMESVEVQNICRDLVHREVYYNVSYLVSELAKVCNDIPYNRDSDLNSEKIGELLSVPATHLSVINDSVDYAIVEHDGAYYWYETSEPTPFKDLPKGYRLVARTKKRDHPGWMWQNPEGEWSACRYDSREEALEQLWLNQIGDCTFDSEEDAAENCCDENGIDICEYDSEVYEHWIVSPFFGRKLQQHGEQVIDFCNMDIWCRCCTGQAIYMDGVIASIAASMEILPGMRYDWSKKEKP